MTMTKMEDGEAVGFSKTARERENRAKHVSRYPAWVTWKVVTIDRNKSRTDR